MTKGLGPANFLFLSAENNISLQMDTLSQERQIPFITMNWVSQSSVIDYDKIGVVSKNTSKKTGNKRYNEDHS